MFGLDGLKNGISWNQALDYAKGLGDGWRVPTKEELMIIYASPKGKEYAPSGVFWSSSAHAHSVGFAWYVLFDSGYVDVYGKDQHFDIRCVRGNMKDLLEWAFQEVLDV